MNEEQRKVKLAKEGNIAIITIENGPLNVLSEEVFQQLGETCDIISNDPEIIAVSFNREVVNVLSWLVLTSKSFRKV